MYIQALLGYKLNSMKTGKLNISWAGGMGKGNSSTISNGDGTYTVGLFNTFNTSTYNSRRAMGMLSPAVGANGGNTYTNTSLAVNITKLSNSYYSINSNGSIDTWNTLGTFSTYGPAVGTFTDFNKDIWTHLFYNSGSPIQAVLFTYVASGVALMGYRVGAASNYSIYTFANVNYPHVGCVSVGNKSYITDGNFIRAYDPNTGTFNSINIGVGYTAKSLCDYGNYVAIVGDDGIQARMWLWDGSAANANYQYEIRDFLATAIVNHNGILRVFTQGKNGTFKLKTFNGSNFNGEANFEINQNMYTEDGVLGRYGNSPKHNQVTQWQNMIAWVTDTGYIWVYGTPNSKEYPEALHNIGYLSDNSTFTVDINATSSGSCLKNVSPDLDLWGSFISTSGNGYIGIVNSGTPLGSTLNPTWGLTTKSYELPHKATIKCIHVYFFNTNYVTDATKINTGISLYLYRTLTGISGGQNLSEELLGTTTNGIIVPLSGSTYQALTYYPYKKSLPNMDLFYLKLVISNPPSKATNAIIIRKIEVEYNYEDGDI